MTAAILADFKTEPYLHQLREFETSADMPARALLWQMRTGKSKVTVDTACHLFKAGIIDAVLVFAPNGVHENWVRRELPIHHWETFGYETCVWRTKISGKKMGGAAHASWAAIDRWREDNGNWWDNFERLLKTKSRDVLPWFAFNSESMTRDDVRKAVARIIRRRKVMVIFDESHDYRAPGSKRTHMARALASKCAIRRILTGTVVTNSPLAAFSQYELLKKSALGFKDYATFKDHFAIYEQHKTRTGRRYPKLKEYQNLELLRDRMAPWSSVLLREDCHDLPAVVRSRREIPLTEEQLRVYRELHREFLIYLDEQEVSVGENTSRLMKMQQVVSGFLIDEFKDVHDIPGINPKLEAVSDEVYLCPGKIIVWCQFQEDIDRVVARLLADGHEVVQYHGRVSDDEKARVRELFAPDAENDVKALVGQPQSGGQGLDLSSAAEILWYSHTFNAITREQADERATAMGGGNVPLTDLVAPGVDEYILANVLNKVDIADAVAGKGLKEALRRMTL